MTIVIAKTNRGDVTFSTNEEINKTSKELIEYAQNHIHKQWGNDGYTKTIVVNSASALPCDGFPYWI